MKLDSMKKAREVSQIHALYRVAMRSFLKSKKKFVELAVDGEMARGER